VRACARARWRAAPPLQAPTHLALDAAGLHDESRGSGPVIAVVVEAAAGAAAAAATEAALLL
jgi:hypothetical protein